MSPSASQPSQSRRSHSRSFSNPFPSLFGSKRNPSHQNGGLLSFPEFADGTGPHPNSLSRSLSPHKHVSGRSIPPEDSSSRKCMTCGHTNSFPKGRKGFRCGKCNTVNDLEPYQQESSLLQVPADGLEMPAVRRSEGSGTSATPSYITYLS
jgi:E3 ubiquitin-protein ligase HECTD2